MGDDINEVQILTPSKRSVCSINKHIKVALYKWGETGFNNGEKVVCTKNNLEASIFNGDIGVLIEKDENYNLEMGGECVRVSMDEIETAYGITVHKSQGSEYETVILYLNRSHGRLLNNKLLYTAVTRAKKKLYIITSKTSLIKAIETKSPLRVSLLENLIRQSSEGGKGATR